MNSKAINKLACVINLINFKNLSQYEMKNCSGLYAHLDVFLPNKVQSNCYSLWVNLTLTRCSYFSQAAARDVP